MSMKSMQFSARIVMADPAKQSGKIVLIRRAAPSRDCFVAGLLAMAPPHTVRTILPIWALDSIRRCASAASVSGKVAWTSGLQRPVSSSGQTLA